MHLRTCLLAALFVSSTALAQDGNRRRAPRGYDGDIDLVRPFFAPENLPGIDVPANNRGGSARWGLAMMYTNSPLVMYEFEEEVGSVIENRFTTFAGLSVDITRAFTVRASMPLYVQWGSDVPKYAAEGYAFGDLDVGAHWAFFRKPAVGLGVRLDVSLPTARRGFYAGDPLPVFNPAFLAMFDVGRVRIASDLGVHLRVDPVETTEELILGHELSWNAGVRVNVIRERLDVGVGVYSRFGFADFFGPGESSGEFLVDLAYKATPWLWVDVAGGRGFTQGYGSSDIRGWVQLRFQKIRPEVVEPVDGFVEQDPNAGGDGGLIFNVNDIDRIVAEGEAGGEPEDTWAEGELSRVKAEQIEIRYAIRFKVGTARLLPESFPVLDSVAGILNGDARIGHLVIEGHASEDGDFEPNYELSIDRAASIWRRLVEQGVHPERISFRGMGEVVPQEATGGLDELQASRRVVFRIARQMEEWEQPPQYDLTQRYPWSGEAYEAVQPVLEQEVQEPTPSYPRPVEAEPDALDDLSFDEADDDLDLAPGDDPVEPAPPEGTPEDPSGTTADEEAP